MHFFQKVKIIFVLTILLSAAITGYAFFVEPNTLTIEKRAIKLDCLKSDWPEKLAQISDLHFNGQTNDEKISRIYKEIKKINPAAVFITGDFISNKEGIEPAAKLARKIAENSKVYAVFGNWDYWALDFEINSLKEKLENSGAKVLINDAVMVKSGGEAINILGVNDPYTSGKSKSDLEKALKKIENSGASCSLLLAHSPEIIKEAAAKNIDLVLAGHTHGGQVYIPGVTEKMIPVRPEGKGFIKGMYKKEKTWIYVNQGIGTSFLPFRFLVPPEITEIALEAEKN